MVGRRSTSSVRGRGPFVAAALTLLVFLLAGCDKKDAAQASSGPKPFSLVVSADTAGWITPCGCTSNQSGGLPRRGTYLTTLRGSGHEVIYADAGGAAGGNSEYHQLKFEALLAGEMKMGLVAHNIGKTEASLGADLLRQAARKSGAPLISSNVRDAAGQLIAEPVKIVAAGGTRIAFVGVLSPSLASPPTKVDEPQAAILSAIAPVKGQYDALVVLAYLPQQELEALAGSLPEADVVVGGPTGQSIAPRKIGRTLIAASTNKGKFLVRLNSEPSVGWGGEVVEMAPALADDAAQQVVLATFLEGLEKRDLPASQTGLVPPVPAGAPANYRIAGSQSCL